MTDIGTADVVPAAATRGADSRRLAEEILACVGPARMLALGPVPAALGTHLAAGGGEMRSDGMDAAEPAQTLVLAVDGAELPGLEARLIHLRELVGRNLVLLVAAAPGAPGRTWIEEKAISAGYRRHPAAFSLPDFERNNGETTERPLVFERIPDTVLARWPLQHLHAERDLHMDMTREAGARADAHLVRYALAAEWIRPGDAVLDCACGLGYGTAALAARSPGTRFLGIDLDPASVAYARDNFGHWGTEYLAASATRLDPVPDRSVDVVVSFETMEHLEDYQSFVAEAARVLRPGGRIIVSVPNQWADETGRDPNPHHHHVFDFERCRAALQPHFEVIARYAQTAPGGTKLREARRSLRQRPLPAASGEPDTEWWIVVAEARRRPQDGEPHAVPSPATVPDSPDAFLAAGFRALAAGNAASARQCFSDGLRCAGAGLLADSGTPAELDRLAVTAGRCADALAILSAGQRSPALLWRRARPARNRHPAVESAPELAAAADEDDLALRTELDRLRRMTTLRVLIPLRIREILRVVLPQALARLLQRRR